MPIALIVDDEPEANRLLARLVQLRGFQSVSAFTAEEARAAIAAQPPDVIFLDLMLPDANGLEICAEIKGRRDTAAIPIVINTARLATENRPQSYRRGANAFIPKPYFPDQIFAALQQAPVWREQAACLPDSQAIPLEAGNEAAAHAAIAALWGLILHRTDWDEGEIARWIGDLNDCVQAILAGARGRQAGRIGTLFYELQPGELRLKVLDEAGWSAEIQPGSMLSAPGRTVEILTPTEQSETVLIVRFDG